MIDRGQPDAVPGWLEEIPTDVGPPWLRMGTRGIPPSAWLVVDGRRDDELEQKRRLLHLHPSTVGAWEPETEAAGEEARSLVEDWLEEHHPEIAREVPAGVRHPLEAAAHLVQEDLCLVADPGAGHRLVAGSVSFPSHWVLGDKLGRSMAAVHAPVPHYEAELARRVDTFFDRLRPGRVVVRRNLSVHDHAELHRPGPAETYETWAPDAGPEGLWLRSERQTLRRLPETGAVLFTIRTQVCPVDTLARVPDVAARLAPRMVALAEGDARAGRAPHVPPGLGVWLASVASSEPVHRDPLP